MRCDGVWGCEFGLGLEIFAREFGASFTLINVYGPYTERIGYWNNFFAKSFLKTLM